MKYNSVSPEDVASEIFVTILKLLEENPDGFRWLDLNDEIIKVHPDFHPKAINKCVFKLVEKYPDRVVKTKEGLFQIIKT